MRRPLNRPGGRTTDLRRGGAKTTELQPGDAATIYRLGYDAGRRSMSTDAKLLKDEWWRGYAVGLTDAYGDHNGVANPDTVPDAPPLPADPVITVEVSIPALIQLWVDQPAPAEPVALSPCPAWCTTDHSQILEDDLRAHTVTVATLATIDGGSATVDVCVCDNLTDGTRGTAAVGVWCDGALDPATVVCLAEALASASQLITDWQSGGAR